MHWYLLDALVYVLPACMVSSAAAVGRLRQPGNFAVETMKPCVETESNLSKVLYRPVHHGPQPAREKVRERFEL